MRRVSKKGGARAGAGRKPSPSHLKQGNRVVLMLTDVEIEQLVKAADDEPLATYARRVLVRHLVQRSRRLVRE